MYRFLVVFRSHHDELADVHFVDMQAVSPLAAIRKALEDRPPIGEWVTARALTWPRGARGVQQAALRYAAKR